MDHVFRHVRALPVKMVTGLHGMLQQHADFEHFTTAQAGGICTRASMSGSVQTSGFGVFHLGGGRPPSEIGQLHQCHHLLRAVQARTRGHFRPSKMWTQLKPSDQGPRVAHGHQANLAPMVLRRHRAGQAHLQGHRQTIVGQPWQFQHHAALAHRVALRELVDPTLRRQLEGLCAQNWQQSGTNKSGQQLTSLVHRFYLSSRGKTQDLLCKRAAATGHLLAIRRSQGLHF
jgi:hypothetical protein